MHKIILSPPFSNIFCFYKHATKILGTYTLKPRRGLWRVFSTLRLKTNGYTNRVGLRNPGVHKAPNKPCIISIAELEYGDFDKILDILSTKDRILGVEFNISCPNASVIGVSEAVIQKAKSLFDIVIIKTPHLCLYSQLLDYVGTGVDYLHISNTKPTKDGALSGGELVELNREKIEYVKSMYPHIKIIAGGGIYNNYTIQQYRDSGADHFSLSTILLNPFKTYKLIKDNK